METYFNIRYEFNRDAVHAAIRHAVKTSTPVYICVADGNILSMVQRDRSYWQVIYDSLFSICDSGWVPLYLRHIYGIRRRQYCGAQIFKDIVSEGRYQMAFLGTDNDTLDRLKGSIIPWNPQVKNMPFTALPFKAVDEFDYPAIAEELNAKNIDIIWIALGAPKQEQFMHRLRPYLKHGVMLGVGAVFNYYSGRVKRAPKWMVTCKLEFAHRLLLEPKKQITRCKGILSTLPLVFRIEKERKLISRLTQQLQTMQNSHMDPGKTQVITAFGQTPAQLDTLLDTCFSHPETRFTIISDDARFWKLPPNANVVPSANAINS